MANRLIQRPLVELGSSVCKFCNPSVISGVHAPLMQTRSEKRYGFLDSLRFIAAALVVVQHLFERQTGIVAEWFVPLGPGVAGVALFFFISGYVIPLSAGKALDWRSFFVRRIFRIYPLYLAALLVIFATAMFGIVPNWADMPSAPPTRWIANLLLIQDFVRMKAFLGVSWTLAIELIWYALFAVTVLRFGPRAAKILDTAIPICLVLLAVASLVSGFRIPLGRPTMIYAAVVGFQCFRHARGELSARGLFASIARFAVIALLCDLVAFGVFSHHSISLAQAIGPWTVGTTIFVAVVLTPKLREHRWLNEGVMPWLGALSYSIYMLHPVAIALADRFASGPLRIVVGLALTLIFAMMAYRLVEKPGIALGRRLAGAQSQPTRAAIFMNGGQASAPNETVADGVPGKSASAARVEWLDVARGIGILLVVAGHALGGLIDSSLGRDFALGRGLFFSIYTFHMPLFMLLSGLLVSSRLERDPQRFRSRLWSGIVWPYFLWSIVQLSIIQAMGSLVNQPLGDFVGTLLSLPIHTVSQFWFLYALFLLHVLALGTLGAFGRQGFLLLCISLKPFAMLVELPEGLHLAANHALFYGIGVCLMPSGLKALVVDRPLYARLALLLLAAVLIKMTLLAADGFDPERQLATAKAAAIANLSWRYEALPAAMAGALGMVALASFARGWPAAVLALLGRRSMSIFVLHIMAIAGVRIVLIKFFHLDQPWPVFALASVAGIALPLLADAVIRRLKIEGWLGVA